MTARQLLLFALVAVCAVAFLVSAVISYVATRRSRPRLERASGDIGFIAFILALPLAVTAVTNDLRILLYALPLILLFLAAAVAFSPRCRQCGERFNVLTNRQFRNPECLFCGAAAR